jgi:diguanylate cyclase (GGDEF)-like protein/PAS domain S-box-containing protein
VGFVAYREYYECTPDGVVFTRPADRPVDRLVLAANPSACRFLGLSEDEIRRRGTALLDPEDLRWMVAFDERRRTGHASTRGRLICGDGRAREADVTSKFFEETDGSVRAILIIRDVSDEVMRSGELRAATHQLERLSTADELTGLRNHRGFLQSGLRVLDMADEHGSDVAALHLLVTNLVDLNARVGHRGGDAGLQAVARAMSVALPDADPAARFGGGEFVALAPGIGETERQEVERQILAYLSAPDTVDFVGAPVAVSCSWAVRHAGSADSLEQLVDQAERIRR